VLGVQFSGHLAERRMTLETGFFYTIAENFHHEDGRKEEYPEIWIKLSHRVF